MYCEKCGSKLADGAFFCEKCGARVSQPFVYDANNMNTPNNANNQNNGGYMNVPNNQNNAGYMNAPNNMNNGAYMNNPGNTNNPGGGKKREAGKESHNKNKKSGKNNMAVFCFVAAAVVLLIVAFAGFVGYKNINYKNNWNTLSDEIDSYEIASFTDEKAKLYEDWSEKGLFSFGEKKSLLDELGDVRDSAKEASEWFTEASGQIATLTDEKDNYNLSDAFADYETYLQDCSDAIEKKDYETAKSLVDDADNRLQTLTQENDAYVNDKLTEYGKVDLSIADVDDKTAFQSGLDQIDQLSSEKKYSDLKQVFDDMDDISYRYIEPQNYLNVEVQQIDASAYPDMKLYVNMEDANTGVSPDNLDQTLFFIRKKDANANYVKQEVTKVSQLNETEALNIGMVADVSGSMEGGPLNEAKSVMSDFVSSVQFSAGDKVELISFSTGVYLEEQFTNSESNLKTKINSLTTGDMTSLYDALYTSVSRVASQSGAKCVIAFTDGLDNYSACSSQDVIDMAQRYHVPIFIIGIDMGNYDEISNIASQTGGKYYEVNSVSSMKDVYDEIYKQEKEMYLIEFKDTSGDISESADIMVGYHSEIYGGECSYSYTPNVLLSVNGSALYNDGPEAVVEGYMRAWDDAITNTDMSYISGFLKPGSRIYSIQEDFIKNDYTETLDSYEIVSVDYSSSTECIVTTRETYYVQTPDEPLSLITQQCKYNVVYENNVWLMTDFAENVKQLSKVNQ
jgi:Mg-chelatase subunit ChlD